MLATAGAPAAAGFPGSGTSSFVDKPARHSTTPQTMSDAAGGTENPNTGEMTPPSRAAIEAVPRPRLRTRVG